MSADSWLEERLDEAPPALARHTRTFLSQVSGGGGLADRLAEASRIALARAEERPTQRAAALDLLAADALVTLALAAQVEEDPDRVAEFAAHLGRELGRWP